MNLLGGVFCSCDGCIWHSNACVVHDHRLLQFDHIMNDGVEDRKKNEAGKRFYKYYIEHPEEAKRRLRVRCANCNWAHRVRSGVNYSRRKTLSESKRALVYRDKNANKIAKVQKVSV